MSGPYVCMCVIVVPLQEKESQKKKKEIKHQRSTISQHPPMRQQRTS